MCHSAWHASPVGVHRLEAPPTALTGLAELLTELSLSMTLQGKKENRNHGAPTCNYHMEGNRGSVSLHPLWSPLKISLRELAVIRTHHSMITPLQSSRNTVHELDAAGGKVVPSRLYTDTDAGWTAVSRERFRCYQQFQEHCGSLWFLKRPESGGAATCH